MHITADTLVAALRSGGLRVTRARTAICEVLARSHAEHLDAATIRERVHAAGGPRVDASTVYRTLETLEEAGVLSHSHLGHRAAVYHLAEEAAHQHLVCTKCGTTVAIGADTLDEWTSALERHTGFVVDPGHFALTGRCGDCAGTDR